MWAQIGERVKKIRKDRNLSKTQFGKILGVSGQYVGMVERGTQNLSVDLIVKICHDTGVSADYILFGVIDPAQDPATTAALHGLSHEQIQIALDIIKKVAQFVNVEDGNESLIQEVASQQRAFQMNNPIIANI